MLKSSEVRYQYKYTMQNTHNTAPECIKLGVWSWSKLLEQVGEVSLSQTCDGLLSDRLLNGTEDNCGSVGIMIGHIAHMPRQPSIVTESVGPIPILGGYTHNQY